MLSRIIVSSYGLFLEIAIWLILIGSLIGGWKLHGFFAGIGALIAAFIFCVVIFGALLVLVDIQRSVKALKDAKNTG
ncbi:MAG: hypothetical protein KGJ55_02815 [Gammaproteobacteria bacterium]|nr:hypothetical protein [Gammaproteobacteria bacterium]